MLIIPYAKSYTVTTAGSIVKFVECESCKAEYVYKLTRQGQGTGTDMLFLDDQGARARAEDEARALLLERLANSCDPVPCPFCGCYQQNMIARLRWHYRRWMLAAGFLAGIAALVCWMLAMFFTTREGAENYAAQRATFWTLTALFAVAARALIWGKYYTARRYDPNREDVDKRKQLGRYRAMSKTDFIKMEQSEQSRDR